MTDLSQYDGWTVDEVVSRNSHQLTAMHLLQARALIVAEREGHASKLARLHQGLEDAHRVGMRVMAAARRGRKTVRVDEVLS